MLFSEQITFCHFSPVDQSLGVPEEKRLVIKISVFSMLEWDIRMAKRMN